VTTDEFVERAMRYLADGGKGCGTWVQYGIKGTPNDGGFRIDVVAKEFVSILDTLRSLDEDHKAKLEAVEDVLKKIFSELQSADSSTTIGEFRMHLERIAVMVRPALGYDRPPREFTDEERHRKLVTEGLPQGLQARRYNPDWTVKK